MLNKKAIFINTASQITVRFMTMAFALISIKILTNYLGPAGVGNYNTITTYINFFIVIADLGLFSVTVREISKNPEKEKTIISNVFIIRLISALLAVIIAVGLVFVTNYDSQIKLGVLICSGFLLFNLLSSIYDMILQYRLKMQYSALAEFLSKLITLLALFVIIKMNGGFLLIISTVLASGILIFIFKYLFAKKFLNFSPTYDKKITAWIVSIAWPLGIVFIVNNLFFKLDTLMLYVIKGSVAVGIYSVAYKLLEVSIIFAGYFSSSLKPTISRNINDKSYLSNVISKSIFVLLLVAAPISAICIAFSKEIIIFLSNNDFISGSNALILLSFTLPLIYLDILLGEILIAKDSRKTLIRISIFILLFNFVTNLIIIPRYSFIGAAFTTALSELVLLLINLHYTRKIVPYSIKVIELLKLLLIFIATIIFGFIIKTTGLYFIFSIVITVLFFAALCQIFGTVKLQTLKSLLNEKT